MVARGPDHFAHSLRATDVTWVDPQAGRARLGRLNGAAVVKVDVSHDWHGRLTHNLPQGSC
jgi:hypothetical protein